VAKIGWHFWKTEVNEQEQFDGTSWIFAWQALKSMGQDYEGVVAF